MLSQTWKTIKNAIKETEHAIITKGIFVFLFLFIYSVYVKITGKSITRDILNLVDAGTVLPLIITLVLSLYFFLNKLSKRVTSEAAEVKELAQKTKNNLSESKLLMTKLQFLEDIKDDARLAKLLQIEDEAILLDDKLPIFSYNNSQMQSNQRSLYILFGITTTLAIAFVTLNLIDNKKFEVSLIFFTAILTSFIIDLLVTLLNKVYLFFSFHIPNSKDRMTVIIAIFGTIISLIALFK